MEGSLADGPVTEKTKTNFARFAVFFGKGNPGSQGDLCTNYSMPAYKSSFFVENVH